MLLLLLLLLLLEVVVVVVVGGMWGVIRGQWVEEEKIPFPLLWIKSSLVNKKHTLALSPSFFFHSFIRLDTSETPTGITD